MQRIIFLDIDGVLNNLGSVIGLGDPSHHLDPVSVGLMTRLCEEAGASIVISSSWRIGRTVESLKDEFDKLGAHKLADRFMDRTKDFQAIRGKQIARWIEDNAYTGRYVIVDDDSDMLPEQKPYFVHTSWEDGFRAKHYRDALKILKPEHEESRIILMGDSVYEPSTGSDIK